MPSTPQSPPRSPRRRAQVLSAPVKLAGFTALLVLLFGAAALAGGAIDPDREASGAGQGEDPATPTGGGHAGSGEDTSMSAPTHEDAASAHGTGTVTITSDSDVDETSLRDAVETSGYEVAS